MFIRVENWTAPMYLDALSRKGFEHGNHLVKVYASQTDPRSPEFFNRETITVFTADDEPFAEDETYSYGDRGTFAGPQLESAVHALTLQSPGDRIVRSLFRFANRPDTQIVDVAMHLKSPDRQWLIHHPFEDIDYIPLAQRRPAYTHFCT